MDGPFLPLLPVGKMRLLNNALFAPKKAIIDPLGINPQRLGGSFDDAPTSEDEKGRVIKLDPCVSLDFYGVITEKQLAVFHKEFKRHADEARITYEGVQTYSY